MEKWASFPCTDDDTNIIKEWYYAPCTPEQENRGDIPMVDFDRHVRIELIPQMRSFSHTMCVRDLNPIRDALILFYGKSVSTLYILGAMPFEQVYALRGYITALQLRNAHSRACAYQDPIPKPYTPTTQLEMPIFIDADWADVNMENLWKPCMDTTIQWYFGRGEAPKTHLRACSAMSQLCSVAIEFCDSQPVDSPIADARKLRNDFDTLRRIAEEKAFRVFMEQFTTQESLLSMLTYNGLKPWLREHICDPTPLDLQHFIRRNTDPGYIPTVFIEIASWEYPEASLPLYKDGLIHLPCHWKYVSPWLWQLRMIQAQTFYTTWNRVKWNDLCRENALFADILRAYAKEAMIWLIQHPLGVEKTQKKRYRRKDGAIAPSSIICTDMEDMWSMLPPCIASLKTSHFPRHVERLQLNPILKEGGISEESAAQWYQELHNRYPNGQDFQNRYPFSKEWDRIPNGVESMYCKTLIDATVEEKPERLHCPFVSTAPKGTPVGETLRHHCYIACAGRRFGGRPALRMRMEMVQEETPAAEENYFTPDEDEGSDSF